MAELLQAYPEWKWFNRWIEFAHACVRMPAWFGGGDWIFSVHWINPYFEAGDARSMSVSVGGATLEEAVACLRAGMKQHLTDSRFLAIVGGGAAGVIEGGEG